MLLTARGARTSEPGEPGYRPRRSAALHRLASSAIRPVLRGLAAIALVIFAMTACVETARHDKLEFIDLLHKLDFETLDARLSGYQEAFEAGRISDEVVGQAFLAFAHLHPQTESLLDLWVSQSEASYAAAMARSVFYAHRTYVTRDLYTKTPPDRVAEMRSYQLRAVEEASRALALKPTLSVAYFHLNWVGRNFNHARIPKSRDKHWIELGLQKVPRSLVLRRAHLDHLANAKGGALEEIKSFLDATKEAFPPDFDLGVLAAFDSYATGLVLAETGRHADAVRLIDYALMLGEDTDMRIKKADLLFRLKRADQAMEELDRTLRVAPQTVGALWKRANRRRMMDRLEGALRDYDALVALDPYNPIYLRSRGMLLSHMERHDAAIEDLDRALVYGGFDPVVHEFRGQVLLAGAKDEEQALSELRQATQMAPENLSFMVHYGLAIAQTRVRPSPERECQSAEVIRNYRRLCQRRGFCDPRAIAKTDEVLAEMAPSLVDCG